MIHTSKVSRVFVGARLKLAASRFSTKGKNVFGSPLPEVLARGGWEAAWQEGVTPWDAGRPAPLLSLLGSAEFNLPGPRVLVPGCGSGHDAHAFAAAGWTATGLDISESAIARCNTNRLNVPAWRTIPPERLRFTEGDFFEHHADYDAVFDYTFVSSLNPSSRQRWASAMRSLLCEPTG